MYGCSLSLVGVEYPLQVVGERPSVLVKNLFKNKNLIDFPQIYINHTCFPYLGGFIGSSFPPTSEKSHIWEIPRFLLSHSRKGTAVTVWPYTVPSQSGLGFENKNILLFSGK